jgi:hypothetical protein
LRVRRWEVREWCVRSDDIITTLRGVQDMPLRVISALISVCGLPSHKQSGTG